LHCPWAPKSPTSSWSLRYTRAYWAKENKLLIEIGGSHETLAYLYDGADLRVNRLPWHRDTAYTPSICKGAMLRMLEVPPVAGETLFCDTD